MPYTDFYTKPQKRVPAPLAFLVVIVATFFVAKVSLDNLKNKASASPSEIRKIEIVNQSSSGASIYWLSEVKNTGWVIYGSSPDKLDQTASDERDVSDLKKSLLNHYVSLKNLNANTPYYFRIVNNDKLASRPDGSPFTFNTLAVNKNTSNLKPAFGKVISPDGNPISNTIVFIRIEDAYTLGGYTKPQGDWLIALNNIRELQTQRLKTLAPEEKIRVEFVGENEQRSVAQTTISNINPLPESITLGKNYDFSTQATVLAANTESASNNHNQIDIFFPKDNAIIPFGKPRIIGIAIPRSQIQLRLTGTGTSLNSTITADSSGNWNYDLSKNLNPGNYSVGIKTKDSENRNVFLTRKFSIAKSGESVLGEATPAATIAPSPTPLSGVTGTPSSPTPPVTGGGINTVLMTSLSLIVIGLGLIFAF